MEARRIILKGRVQGVGFRYFVYREAQRLPVGGWVRNLWNGDVEIHAEGSSELLRRFVDRVRDGPSMARVTECRVTPVDPANHSEFSIRG